MQMMLAARRTSQPRTVCLSPEQQAAQKEADWLKSQDRAVRPLARPFETLATAAQPGAGIRSNCIWHTYSYTATITWVVLTVLCAVLLPLPLQVSEV